MWEEITDSGNGPSKRSGHSAVLDAQRMWIFGGTFLGDGGLAPSGAKSHETLLLW